MPTERARRPPPPRGHRHRPVRAVPAAPHRSHRSLRPHRGRPDHPDAQRGRRPDVPARPAVPRDHPRRADVLPRPTRPPPSAAPRPRASSRTSCSRRTPPSSAPDPKSLLLWKQLGLRICQLTYNEQNLLGAGCLERHDGGLSQLGRVMVREMERYGITIDLTHAGRRTFMDIAPPPPGRSSPRTRTPGRWSTTRGTSTTTRCARWRPRAGWCA